MTDHIENAEAGSAVVTPVADDGLGRRVAFAALAIVVAADWLLFSTVFGISIPIFALILIVASLIANPVKASAGTVALSGLISLVGLLPVIEDVNTVSIAFAVLAVGYFVRSTLSTVSRRPTLAVLDILVLLVSPFVRFVQFMERDHASTGAKPETKQLGSSPYFKNVISIWALPLTFGAIFLGLLFTGNPVLENLIKRLNFSTLAAYLAPERIAFWTLALLTTWFAVKVRIPELSKTTLDSLNTHDPELKSLLNKALSEAGLIRALVVFNLIFLLQTASDIAFLWSGAKLPTGMTYAGYAQSGFVALTLAALLAGLLVLVGLYSGGEGERSKFVRALVVIWIAQNLLLVCSVMFRLSHYVDAYALTLLRVFAAIQLGLIAAGLALIAIRVILRLSNGWLLDAITVMVLATLYAASFVNYPYLVADHNLTKDREVARQNPLVRPCWWSHFDYLKSLGPDIIPAIDRDSRSLPSCAPNSMSGSSVRAKLTSDLAASRVSWTSWTYRSHRLTAHVERTSPTEP